MIIGYFYKTHGITATACSSDYVKKTEKEVTTRAQEMIVAGLRDGLSLQQQGDEYIEQLEYLIQKYNMNGSRQYGDCPFTHTERIIWMLNVMALLKLKRIPNDDGNGFLQVTYNR